MLPGLPILMSASILLNSLSGISCIPEYKEKETTYSVIDEVNSGCSTFSYDNTTSLDDPKLQQYLIDQIEAAIEERFDEEECSVVNIDTAYIPETTAKVSKEYLEELEFNSKQNVYFGYNLEDVKEVFDGEHFVFSVGEEGKTIVKAFEKYDDTNELIFQNFAVGSGVILFCITLSVTATTIGAPETISLVLAASAKSGVAMAASSATMGAIISGIVTGIRTKDFKEAEKAAAIAASEGFKWGAITGVITGGIKEALDLRNAIKTAEATEEVVATSASTIPSNREAELRALERFGGSSQRSFIAGKEVPYGTPGSTRPDIIRELGDHLEAIEVKNYDLTNGDSVRGMFRELARQVGERVENMPKGTTQRIVLNVEGRNYSTELVASIVEQIHLNLDIIYPNIPITIMG